MSFYPLKINRRFLDPQYVDEIERPDAASTKASFICGAVLRIELRINNEKIEAAAFKAAGCGFLIAAADFLCENIHGKAFSELLKQPAAICEQLNVEFNSIAAERQHCFELCAETLLTAIKNFNLARNESWNGDETLVCNCFGVSEKTIEAMVSKSLLATVEDVTRACNAGGGCGSCQPLIRDILDDFWREQF